MAQTADLRVQPPPRAGDEDAAEGSWRLRRFPDGLDTDGTPATVATRFSSRTAGGGSGIGAARSDSAFTVDGQGEELDIAMHDTGKMKKRRRRCL